MERLRCCYLLTKFVRCGLGRAGRGQNVNISQNYKLITNPSADGRLLSAVDFGHSPYAFK
jgi:hypothetical protein